jgi:uncharacterized protein
MTRTMRVLASALVGAAIASATAMASPPVVELPPPYFSGPAASVAAAAERGDVRAQTRLGYMYEYGTGVPQNMVEAAYWLHRAAVAGDPQAQYLIGELYDKGFGVPQDPITSYVWYNLAASRAQGRNREHWPRVRDGVGSTLTLDQLAQARARSLAWRPGVDP